MDNLVSQTYLHNTKWNFLNNLAEVGAGINGSNYRTAKEISLARQKLEQKRDDALFPPPSGAGAALVDAECILYFSE